MRLSNKKLKFIKRNADSMSPAELAQALKIRVKDVEKGLASLGIGFEARPAALGKGNVADEVFFYLFAVFCALSPYFIRLQSYDYANLPQAAWIQCGVFFFFALWALKGAFDKPSTFCWPMFLPPIILFLAWSLVSLWWAPNNYEGIVTWMHWTACAGALFLAAAAIKTKAHARLLLLVLFFSGFVAVLFGIGQYLFELDWVPQVSPPSSVFANKNMAVHFAILTIPIGFGFFLEEKKSLHSWLFAMAVAAMIAFLIYTKTRAGWLAFGLQVVFGVVVYFGLVHRKKPVIHWNRNKTLACFGSLVFLFVMINMSADGPAWKMGEIAGRVSVTAKELVKQLTEKDEPPPPLPESLQAGVEETAEAQADGLTGVEDEPPTIYTPALTQYDISTELRLAIWRNTLEMIKEYPLAGVGLGNHKVYYPLYVRSAVVEKIFSEDSQLTNAHNDFVQALAETGLVGLALLAWLAGAMAWVVYRLLVSDMKQDKLLVLAIATAIFGLMVNAFFSFPFQRSVPPLVFMLYLGVLGYWYGGVSGKPLKTLPKMLAPILAICFAVGFVLMVRLYDRWLEADQHYLRITTAEKMELWDMVIREGEIAYALNPNRNKIQSYLGRAHIESQRYEEGIDALEKVIAAYPNHMNALLNLGVAYGSMGQYGKALEIYDRVLAIKPDYAKAHNNIANVLLRQKDLPGALKAFQRAGHYNPQSAVIQFNIGVVALQLKKFKTARQALERAVKLDPKMAVAHKNLGVLLFQILGEREEGIKHLKKAMELDPSSMPPPKPGGPARTGPALPGPGPVPLGPGPRTVP